LLDACFQAVFGLNFDIGYIVNNKNAYLPFEIEHILFANKAARKVYAHIQAIESMDDKVKNANLDIYDESGALLLEIKGFRSISVSKEVLLQKINVKTINNVADYLYELSWKEQAFSEVSAPVTSLRKMGYNLK